MPTPGIGDPYWYEWFVGLKYVIEMLNPDNGISSVTFQCSQYATIDDVVVEYGNGQKEICYQVKHEISTSVANNLTFGKMLESKKNKPCLFKALYTGWKRAAEVGASIKPVLYSNRKLLNRRAGRKYGERNYSAYSVDQFLRKTREILKETTDYSKFEPEDSDLMNQWNELWEAVDKPEKESLLEFLALFSVEANQPSLLEMEELLIDSLAKYFQCEKSLANELFTRLLRGLTKWTTSERDREKVTVENVLTVLGVEEDHDASQHRLAPPFPFFFSRKEFCDDLLNQLNNTDKKLIFISGDPGSGKTSTISYLQSSTGLFYLRYHTFRPISPEQRFYDSDHGLCSMEKLWGTLLIQLRRRFAGRMRELDIPVSNKLLSRELLRKKVLELLAISARENEDPKNKLFICIDGIDHAARAMNQVSFLSSLPVPAEIPEGVCFVIVGQPLTLYQDQYPSWLGNNLEIQYIDIPKLLKKDIEQLIIERIPQFTEDAANLSVLIHEKTAGNNLSAAFIVEEIKEAASLDEAYRILSISRISDNVNQYYDHMWSHLKEILAKIMPGRVFPESYIACPLLLLNGRVNIRILAKALKHEISITDWRLIFKRLHPLVIQTENPDEYALFHNDFRVYLQGIIHQFKDRYEEMAYTLAKYLLENDEGLISYALGITLLKHANKLEEIPKYFNTGFVVNALAEGISQERLDTFARDAYYAACENRDYSGYCNVYLAIKTIYQHRSYYEYFNREYISLDFPEIEQTDIAEIRVLPISKDSLAEYEIVLELCKKLELSSRNDGHSRAMSLYDLWFGECTPLSFLSIIQDDIKDEEFSLKTTDVGILLQNWGCLAADLKISVIDFEKKDSFLEKYAVKLWGNAYFSCCIENKQYDLAVDAVEAGVVSRDCFAERIEQLLYSGAASQFQHILSRISFDEAEPLEHLLALVMQVICSCDYIPEVSEEEISARVKHIFDKSCFELILQAFLLGKLNINLEDDALLQEADGICAAIEGDKTSKQQAIYLVRTAILLGKYFWSNEEPSDRLKGYVIWYLTATMYRSFDCSKACRFILFILLHCCPLRFFAQQQDFLNALRKQLFENQQLGMYYKTDILEFYIQHNMSDIVREYILALYGENCQEISSMENKADMHARFSSYGAVVEPVMMRQFSDKLKWDVVGYLGYDEYALYGPLELYELIVQDNSLDWKRLGYVLYQQSEIANNSSNKASYQIYRKLSEVAANNSLADYWELRSWNDEFRLNTDSIVYALLGAIKSASNVDDLITLWLLGCGINSWYTVEEHQAIKNIYNACIKRSEYLNVKIDEIIAKLTPQWIDIVLCRDEPDQMRDDTAAYYSKRKEDMATITNMFAVESIEDMLKMLPVREIYSDERIGYPLDYYEIALSRISEENEQIMEYYGVLLDRLCIYLQDKEWHARDKYDFVIGKLLQLLTDNAFWKFAICIGQNLSKYNYQTSSRNMQLLLKIFSQRDREELNSLLNRELVCQNLWVTGNNHIDIQQKTLPSITQRVQPYSIQEASVYILTEQINTQNPRKVEAAVYAISLLGQQFQIVMDLIADNWDSYTYFQKEFLLHPIVRWAVTDRCSVKLSLKLKEAYDNCSNLVMKLRLHGVMLCLKEASVQSDEIKCIAGARDHSLPSSGEEAIDCYYDRFIDLIGQVIPTEDIMSIRRILMSTEPLKTYIEDPFAATSDSRLPSISNIPGEVFYQFEKEKALSAIPLFEKKARLLTSDDSFVLTSMPSINFTGELLPSLSAEHSIKAEIDYPVEKLNAIVQKDILPNEVVAAASLWIPWRQNDGIVFNRTIKVGCKWTEPDTIFDWCIGNFSELVYAGGLKESHFSSVGNRSLFNKVGGNQMVFVGNCRFVPSSAWRKLLKCSPRKDNPLEWVDLSGKPVLRFEYIASPNRMLAQQAYVRQPILFRWICDKSWFDETLQKLDLCSYVISEIEAYPSTQAE